MKKDSQHATKLIIGNLLGILHRPTSLDVVQFGEDILGAHGEVPDVPEGRVATGLLHLGMRQDRLDEVLDGRVDSGADLGAGEHTCRLAARFLSSAWHFVDFFNVFGFGLYRNFDSGSIVVVW